MRQDNKFYQNLSCRNCNIENKRTKSIICSLGTSQWHSWVKNPPSNAEDARDMGSIPGLGRSPGEENGNLLQYSCLGNPRRACQRSLVGYSAWGHRVRMHFTHLFPQRLIVHVLLVQKNISIVFRIKRLSQRQGMSSK